MRVIADIIEVRFGCALRPVTIVLIRDRKGEKTETHRENATWR